MKIDTVIRHVTKPGANLFLELGFTPDEAKRLQAASRKQINDTRLLKQQLMKELSVWIAKHHLKQAEAAEILMVSRPRVSDVVNKKTAKFTIDTLVEMLSRVGKPFGGDRLMQFWRWRSMQSTRCGRRLLETTVSGEPPPVGRARPPFSDTSGFGAAIYPKHS
jgi:predicted XRE-type DNA-binding protein